MLLRNRSSKIDVLQKVPLFRDLSKRQLDEIAKHADEIEGKPGEVLVRQGEVGHELIIIVEGSARVERDGQVIAHLKSGDFLGEMSLLDGKPRSATVITEIPGTLLVIHSRSFGPLLDTVPGLQRKMLTALVERFRELQQTLMH
jgi:CRP/FNR family transcriptional regulator, cyclic AMP receptor protein